MRTNYFWCVFGFLLDGLITGFVWNVLLTLIFPALPVLAFWQACLLGLLITLIFTILNKK